VVNAVVRRLDPAIPVINADFASRGPRVAREEENQCDNKKSHTEDAHPHHCLVPLDAVAAFDLARPLAVTVPLQAQVGVAVYLYIAALDPKIRFCRRQGAGPDCYGTGSHLHDGQAGGPWHRTGTAGALLTGDARSAGNAVLRHPGTGRSAQRRQCATPGLIVAPCDPGQGILSRRRLGGRRRGPGEGRVPGHDSRSRAAHRAHRGSWRKSTGPLRPGSHP
jgi:hypothetical protein